MSIELKSIELLKKLNFKEFYGFDQSSSEYDKFMIKSIDNITIKIYLNKFDVWIYSNESFKYFETINPKSFESEYEFLEYFINAIKNYCAIEKLLTC